MSTAPIAPAAGRPGPATRIAAVRAGLGRVPLGILQLGFRLGIAGVFFRAGLTKWQSWPTTLQLFADEYRVPVLPPELAAGLATALELGCSTLLVLGLLTRLATLPLLGMLLTIQLFVYPGAWADHLVWGSLLAFLLTRGPGALSLDRALGLEPGPAGSRA